MKLVLPIAGKGTRMRPITHTIAKPLIPIAGKPVIQHIIDTILNTQNIEVSEIIFITGWLGDQVVTWAEKQYDVPVRFVEQKIQNGSADAIRLAEDFVGDEDMLVVFADSIFDADLEVILEDEEADGIIWCSEVEDPRRFGVVNHDPDMWMTELVEKPDEPESNLANIGVYYIRDPKSVFAMIDVLYEEEIRTKGEYNFPEALDLMAKNGKNIRVQPVEGWYDTGVHGTTLATNKEFCGRKNMENSLHDSVIMENSTAFNCIIMEGARIINCDLENSIIGPRSIVKHTKGQVIVGSDAIINGNDNRE